MELLKIIKAFEKKGFDVVDGGNGRFVADFENHSIGFQLEENSDVVYVRHHISNDEILLTVEQLLHIVSSFRTI